MPHVDIKNENPGIVGLMTFRPETAMPLNALAEVLLRGPSTLSRGEREIIAAFVSRLNDCEFCSTCHAAIAKHSEGVDATAVEAVLENPLRAPVSEKLKALLIVASKVQKGGLHVTRDDVDRAKKMGATDIEVHDTVLIAAAFCMYNRYVDGLASITPTDANIYEGIGQRIAEVGYESSLG